MAMELHAISALGRGGFHRITYTEWGARDNPQVLLCVHGLTRSGRDFDFLAAALEDGYRVVCPDMAGRGASGWLADSRSYGYQQYCADMAALIARLGAVGVDWLGTSMGGIVGMLMAAMPGTPVRRLILNDVGPFIPKAALERIRGYVTEEPVFDFLEAAEARFRTVMASFGPLSDEQWRHVTTHGTVRRDGKWCLHYDPGVGDAFRAGSFEDVDMWATWDAITCPVLVIRGADSDLLLAETAREMGARGPGAELVELAGMGHAPALMAADQIALVRDWLARTES
jgi:pimeloyl-ACP methyl ester carboxylesterase